MPLLTNQQMPLHKVSTLLEIAWSFSGDGEEANFQFLRERAYYKTPSDDQFILYIGDGSEEQHWGTILRDMAARGCTEDFMQTYRQAGLTGATYVLFWS